MDKKERIYIFDMDHTLFNAKKFREDIGVLLSGDKNIISEDIWNYFNAKDEKLFNFILEKADKYIFDSVYKNIEKIKEEKILLTFGNIDFQNIKVKSTFFDKIFDKVILVDENKITFLKDFYEKNKTKEIIFVNDNYNKRFNENKEVKEKIPEIKIFEIDNYNKKNKKTIDNFFKKIFL